MDAPKFIYAPPEERKAKAWYLLAISKLQVRDLHRLLCISLDVSMVGKVLRAIRKSARLEERIATVLGVTREELFGNLPLRNWLTNGNGGGLVDAPKFGHMYRSPRNGLVVTCVPAPEPILPGMFAGVIIYPGRLSKWHVPGELHLNHSTDAFEEVKDISGVEG